MAVSPLHDSDEKENKELSAEEKQLVKSGQKFLRNRTIMFYMWLKIQ